VTLDDPARGGNSGLIADLVAFGVLAPSLHNTQPWVVSSASDDEISVAVDASRRLSAADPTGRQAGVSVGAFVTNVQAAGESFGRSVDVTYSGRSVKLTIGGNLEPERDWRPAIRSRRSDRRPFRPDEVDCTEWLSASTVGQAILHVVTSAERELVADLHAQAAAATLADRAFRMELARWVRMNWSQRLDGMPVRVQGLTGVKGVLAPWLIRSGLGAKQLVEMQRKTVQRGGTILVLSANDDFDGWIDAGRTYERVCLHAVDAGFSASSFAAVAEVDSVADKVCASLGLAGRPMALIRVGHSLVAGEPPPSPRRLAGIR
jgi:hypothetical protein